MSELECNPSPPNMTAEEDELLKSEYIGDSLFSKSWVLRLLVKLCEASNAGQDDDSSDLPRERSCVGATVKEIDSELETELCELWDMTINREVALFLEDHGSVDIILAAASKLKNTPRLMEICIGILGNMACVECVQEKLAKEQAHMDHLIAFLAIEDAPTLHELVRLLHTCLMSRVVQQKCVTSFDEANVLPQLCFLISTTCKSNLLLSLAELIDSYLDLSDNALEDCLTDEVVTQLCEAYHESHKKCRAAMAFLLHCFQLLSTEEKGIEIMASKCFDFDDDCGCILTLVLRHLSDRTPRGCGERDKEYAAAASCFSVATSLCQTQRSILTAFIGKDANVIGNALLIARFQIDKLQTFAKENGVASDDSRSGDVTEDERLILWETYLTTSISFLLGVLEAVADEKPPLLIVEMRTKGVLEEISQLFTASSAVLGPDTEEVSAARKQLASMMNQSESPS